ncbi:hypothetical protein [Variovorax sp. YR752]|uniref:hypothetical protein n=1 Tax=Variovorax sp. YR752 TaxID=1884383 RepID=UPI003137FC2A
MPVFRTMRRRGARVLLWTLLIAILLFGIKYCFEARARVRADNNPDGWWSSASDVQDEAYTAKRASIGNNTILLRLYRTGDPTLLAERSYQKHGVEILWTEHELIYDTSDASYLGGGTQLPPTRLDNFLAKLP